jgi:putative acetyltransferase
MLIRRYRSGEESYLLDIFYNTIHRVNIRDYSQSQVSAWAPPGLDTDIWRTKIESINPFVAIIDEHIIGYADLQENGLIDHFFCDYRWQRKGVGSLLMAKIHEEALSQGMEYLFSEVSITAKPFYTSHGFIVIKNQMLDIRGEKLINFKMEKQLTNG